MTKRDKMKDLVRENFKRDDNNELKGGNGMVKFNKKHWDEIEKGFNNSPVWKEINERIKNTYKKHNRKPTSEEYQMVRQMIACKTILEDENIMNTMNKCTWEALQDK